MNAFSRWTGLLLLTIFPLIGLQAQGKYQKAVLQSIEEQKNAWNKGDLTGFMDTYWHSDSLMFVGKSGVTYGWQATLDNYRRGYPDTAAMGKLDLQIIDVKKLKGGYCHVTGRWHLSRSMGDLKGHFTLLFKKIKRRWLIIEDHSS
jgi:ketosteroid isomerase-like protein